MEHSVASWDINCSSASSRVAMLDVAELGLARASAIALNRVARLVTIRDSFAIHDIDSCETFPVSKAFPVTGAVSRGDWRLASSSAVSLCKSRKRLSKFSPDIADCAVFFLDGLQAAGFGIRLVEKVGFLCTSGRFF